MDIIFISKIGGAVFLVYFAGRLFGQVIRFFDPGPRFEMPGGVNFHLKDEIPVERLLEYLDVVIAFLFENYPKEKLYKFDDWLQHDGLHFFKREIDYSELKRIVVDEKTLLRSMPGDDWVRVGVSDKDCVWYLRFYIDDLDLEGDFDVTVSSELAHSLRQVLGGIHGENLLEEEAAAYYDRITDSS